MVRRRLFERVTALLAESPAVALVGPRQCGKTTLARSFGGEYFDLEQESERLRLDLLWDSLVASQRLIILDEAQSWPAIFPRLRGTIDADRKRTGRVLLLGSVSPALMTQVSESLAGRLALLELTPFLADELPGTPIDTLWLVGGFPDGGILRRSSFPRWQNDYLQLLVQRDLPAWGLPAKPQMTMRFLKMLAASHGQTWNASRLAQSLGIDYKTVNAYLDFLEGTFLIRRLPAYSANTTKRLVKASKVYVRDSGLLHALLNVPDAHTLLNQPWVGASWEGFVIEQLLNHLHSAGERFDAYHFRTSDQHEIDLVLEWADQRIATEIKLTASPSPADLARLNATADLIGATRRILISRVAQPVRSTQAVSCDLPYAIDELLGKHHAGAK